MQYPRTVNISFTLQQRLSITLIYNSFRQFNPLWTSEKTVTWHHTSIYMSQSPQNNAGTMNSVRRSKIWQLKHICFADSSQPNTSYLLSRMIILKNEKPRKVTCWTCLKDFNRHWNLGLWLTPPPTKQQSPHYKPTSLPLFEKAHEVQSRTEGMMMMIFNYVCL